MNEHINVDALDERKRKRVKEIVEAIDKVQRDVDGYLHHPKYKEATFDAFELAKDCAIKAIAHEVKAHKQPVDAEAVAAAQAYSEAEQAKITAIEAKKEQIKELAKEGLISKEDAKKQIEKLSSPADKPKPKKKKASKEPRGLPRALVGAE